MTNIGDLLGEAANELLQSNINIGDVHLLNLDLTNGITPKNGDATRNKSSLYSVLTTMAM